MRQLFPAAVLSAALLAGCTYNIKISGNKTYRDLSIKSISTGSIQAASHLSFVTTSTSTPTEGMVVISTERTKNNLFWATRPSKMTITIIEPESGTVRVEAILHQGDDLDFGENSRQIVERFYSRLDESLNNNSL